MTNSDYGRHKSIEGVVPMSLLGPVALVSQEFDALVRQFYIRSAELVLPLASRPEFRDALELLETFDRQPTEENLARLVQVHDDLESKQNKYGSYTPSSEFRRGLLSILTSVIYKLDSVASSDVIHFAEVAWTSARTTGARGLVSAADEAFRQEMGYQDLLFKFIFD